MIKNKIKSIYPNFFEEELLNNFNEFGEYKQFYKNDILIDVNQNIKGIPILLNGAVKILREDFEHGELLIYFLEKGDTCSFTIDCCLGKKESKIRAIAETDGELILLPAIKMDHWMANYSSWRNFILKSYNNRLDEMLEAIDNLAFHPMKNRLKKYLLDIAAINKSKSIYKTHQEIAHELNTSRVVISRLLKSLEANSFLQLHRNEIKIIAFQ